MAATTLITGATGLIGSWTLRHWRGTPPVVVGRDRTDLLRPEAATALLDETSPDAVVHLAWSASGTSGYRDSPMNARWLEATLELARQCRLRGVHLYCTGTVADDQASTPGDEYTRSKQALRAALAGDLESGAVTWLRPHYVFDPTAGRPAVVQQALAARARSEPVILDQPAAEHDFVHASDVGTAVVHVVAHRLRGIVEIGSGRTRKVREIVEQLGAVWSCSSLPQLDSSTPPAKISALTATGWAPARTEEFFAHV